MMEIKKEEKLEFNEMISRVWQGRKTLYRAVGIAFVLGILIVLLTPRTYTTQIKLLSETQSKSSGAGLLGQLGNLSGMNIGNILGLNIGGSSGSDVLSPDIYPEIIQSTPFLLDVMHRKVSDSKMKQPVLVSDYLNHHADHSIIGFFSGLFKRKTNGPLYANMPGTKDAVYRMDKKQTDLLKSLKEMISIDVQKSGDKLLGGRSKILTVSVEATDPLASALLADTVVNTLKSYVVDYNTGKAKKDMKFIRSQYDVARKNYKAAQQKLADFNDSHTNIILERVKSERQRLQKDYNLAASLYTTLAQMLEKAKIEVQDRTPVFTIIEPAKVPLRKSAPKTSLILISMIFIGAFVGIVIELVKYMRHP